MPLLILVRHGESQFNKKNLFTGWTDVLLSSKGKQEAKEAGKKIKKHGHDIHAAFSSKLKRSAHTLDIILDTMKLKKIPILRSKALNERHYGILTKMHKKSAAEKYGQAQIDTWRYSHKIGPPKGESLKDVTDRVMPFFNTVAIKHLKEGKNVLISAHHHSIRSIISIIDRKARISDIPNGIPLVYELDDKLKPIKHYFLA